QHYVADIARRYDRPLSLRQLPQPPLSTLFPYTNALPISSLLTGGQSAFRSPGRGVWRTRRQRSAAVLKSSAPAKESIGPMISKRDRKSTRLNSSHVSISYAVFCLKKKTKSSSPSVSSLSR